MRGWVNIPPSYYCLSGCLTIATETGDTRKCAQPRVEESPANDIKTPPSRFPTFRISNPHPRTALISRPTPLLSDSPQTENHVCRLSETQSYGPGLSRQEIKSRQKHHILLCPPLCIQKKPLRVRCPDCPCRRRLGVTTIPNRTTRQYYYASGSFAQIRQGELGGQAYVRTKGAAGIGDWDVAWELVVAAEGWSAYQGVFGFEAFSQGGKGRWTKAFSAGKGNL